MHLATNKNKKRRGESVHFQLLLLSLMVVGVFFYIIIQKMDYIMISTNKVTPTVLQKEDRQINIVLTQPVQKVKPVKPIEKVKKVFKKVKQKPNKPIAEKKVKIKKTPSKKVEVEKVLETVVKKPVTVSKKTKTKPVVEKVVQKPKKTVVVFDAKMKDDFINELYELLNKNKKYPKMAKRRHLEGTSYVGFTLCKDGSIKDVVLIKSSGHKILDKASLKLLKKIGFYKPIPETVSKASLNLKIPIKYKRI